MVKVQVYDCIILQKCYNRGPKKNPLFLLCFLADSVPMDLVLGDVSNYLIRTLLYQT